MKKCICMILILLLLPCASACSHKSDKNTVTFYYPRVSYLYDDTSGVIGEDTYDLPQQEPSTDVLVREYLKGPQNDQLHSPLTGRVELTEISVNNNTLLITFSDSIDQLMPAELISSLAALAMTCFEISEVEEVHISAESALLDGQQQIIFTRDSILLWDSCIESPPTTQSAETSE